MLKRFFADFSKYFKYAKYASKSALNAEVAGSYLNWLWWIFNPFCMMLYVWIRVWCQRTVFPDLHFSWFDFMGLF